VPTSLVIVADTHVPKRARELPSALWRDIDDADVVIHAGDWVDAALLDELEARARVVGVYGNNDHGELRERLPEVAEFTAEGVRIAVVHETGAATGRERRCDERFGDLADVLVFGHSHIPWDTTTPHGLRLLNPGSPTDRRREPVATYLTAVADAGVLHDVTLVPLPH